MYVFTNTVYGSFENLLIEYWGNFTGVFFVGRRFKVYLPRCFPFVLTLAIVGISIELMSHVSPELCM